MFNRELERRVSELEDDAKRLRIRVYCLQNVHEWIVEQDMVIRCRHCYKRADKMPDATNTQPKNEGSEAVTNCNRLKMVAEDGKLRFTAGPGGGGGGGMGGVGNPRLIPTPSPEFSEDAFAELMAGVVANGWAYGEHPAKKARVIYRALQQIADIRVKV